VDTSNPKPAPNAEPLSNKHEIQIINTKIIHDNNDEMNKENKEREKTSLMTRLLKSSNKKF
jgi:hypothetical protein